MWISGIRITRVPSENFRICVAKVRKKGVFRDVSLKINPSTSLASVEEEYCENLAF